MATTTLTLSQSPSTNMGSGGGSRRRMIDASLVIPRLSSPSPPRPKPRILKHHLPLSHTLQPKASTSERTLTAFWSPVPILEVESHDSVGAGKILSWVFSLACFCCFLFLVGCGSAVAVTPAAAAAEDSIRASNIGLKIASALRKTGVPDEAIVFALATLPVLELRGAIPVGYWMQLNPLVLTTLAILGNTLPVPFVVLYLKRLVVFLSLKSNTASRFLDALLRRARDKAGPVQEFRWLGLTLFVAVPFPGTGAWTGAIVASVLDMPFWPAVSANFMGVILAGLLVNLLVNLGLKYAVATGVLLVFLSTIMWSVLRQFKKTINSE